MKTTKEYHIRAITELLEGRVCESSVIHQRMLTGLNRMRRLELDALETKILTAKHYKISILS